MTQLAKEKIEGVTKGLFEDSIDPSSPEARELYREAVEAITPESSEVDARLDKTEEAELLAGLDGNALEEALRACHQTDEAVFIRKVNQLVSGDWKLSGLLTLIASIANIQAARLKAVKSKKLSPSKTNVEERAELELFLPVHKAIVTTLTLSEYEASNRMTIPGSTRANNSRFCLLHDLYMGIAGDKSTSFHRAALTRCLGNMSKTARVRLFSEFGIAHSVDWLNSEEKKDTASHFETNLNAMASINNNGGVVFSSGDNLDHKCNSQDAFIGGTEKHLELHEMTCQSYKIGKTSTLSGRSSRRGNLKGNTMSLAKATSPPARTATTMLLPGIRRGSTYHRRRGLEPPLGWDRVARVWLLWPKQLPLRTRGILFVSRTFQKRRQKPTSKSSSLTTVVSPEFTWPRTETQ
jgi:hypothetical protein